MSAEPELSAEPSAERRGRRGGGGGAEGRRAARRGGGVKSFRYIKREIPLYEVLGEEGLTLIENNCEKVLQEIGIDFRDDAEALQMWKDAGADVKGERVRFPKGLVRGLIKTAPSQFTQHSRNPERNVIIGGASSAVYWSTKRR